MNDLQDLEELWLGCNQLQTIGELCFPRLRIISLSSNKLVSVAGIQNCPNISECLLDNNVLSDIEPLKYCVFVRLVDVSYNKVANIDPLISLKMSDLWISHNPLDAIPELFKLEHKMELESVAVQGCRVPSEQALNKILIGQFPNLRTINGTTIA